MTLPPLPLIDGVLFVDNSFLDRMVCYRETQYAMLQRRIPTGVNAAINFGTAGHLVWEHRYKTYGTRPPDEKLEAEQVELLTKFFADNPPPEGDRRDLNYAIELFVKRYNKRYAVETFELFQNDKGEPLVELSFALPLFKQGTLQIFYNGRIDLPVREHNRVIIYDNKTASNLNQYYFEGERVSPQYEGYCWSFEQLTGIAVDGYCINGVRTAEKPEYVLKWEAKRSALDAFEDTPLEAPVIFDANGKKKSDPKVWWHEAFQRDKVYLRPGQLDAWKQNTIVLIEEFFWHYSRGYLPQRKKWCVGKYGKCGYYEICHGLPEEQRELVLNSGMFIDNNWSPLRQPTKQTQNANTEPNNQS